MKIEYTWTREDLKRKLKKKRFFPNIIFIVFGAIAYFVITDIVIVQANTHLAFDTIKVLIGFAIYMVVLAIVTFLITKLYIFSRLRRNDKRTSKAYGTYYIEVTEENITSTINDTTIVYEWKSISKFKRNKKWFFISTRKDKIGLLFSKDVINEEDYEILLKYVSKKLKSEEV